MKASLATRKAEQKQLEAKADQIASEVSDLQEDLRADAVQLLPAAEI